MIKNKTILREAKKSRFFQTDSLKITETGD